jgi:hypothetical protein
LATDNQWLFLHSLHKQHRPSTGGVLRRQHSRVLPHSAFRGQTPDEMYFGTRSTVSADLHHGQPPRAEPAWQPTDRHRARLARQSTRPRDQGVLTASDDRTAGHRVSRRPR